MYQYLNQRYIIRTSLIIGALWFLGLTHFINNIPRYIPDSDTRVEAAVILTGGSHRLDNALTLLQKNTAERLFISGVGVGINLEEILEHNNNNLPKESKRLIEIGHQAKNTHGNASEIADWVNKNNIQSLRIVTAHYHMQRSLLELRALLPNTVILINPVFPENIRLKYWWQHSGTLRLLVKEYNKYLFAYARLMISIG